MAAQEVDKERGLKTVTQFLTFLKAQDPTQVRELLVVPEVVHKILSWVLQWLVVVLYVLVMYVEVLVLVSVVVVEDKFLGED